MRMMTRVMRQEKDVCRIASPPLKRHCCCCACTCARILVEAVDAFAGTFETRSCVFSKLVVNDALRGRKFRHVSARCGQCAWDYLETARHVLHTFRLPLACGHELPGQLEDEASATLSADGLGR